MANYKLGPIIGKIGGGVEIITEQVEIGASSSRSWELPDGWESGFVALAGEVSNTGYDAGAGMTLFGVRSASLRGSDSGALHAFGDLPGEVSTDRNVTWSGTVTMIRTA